jgi:hypothetical protein
MKNILNPNQSSTKFSFVYIVCIALMLAGCGGGGSTTPITLTSIAIMPDPVFVGAGTTLSLTATGTYSNGTTADLTSSVIWKSAASAVASVDSTGLLTAGLTSPSTTTVTAALNGVTSAPDLVTVTSATSISSTGLNIARYDHTGTLLNDGRVLAAGGFGTSGTELASAEMYTPGTTTNTGTWTTTPNMTVARRDHTATLLPTTGQVLILGGGARTDLDSGEMYTPASGVPGTWTALPGILTTPRSYHTATLLNSLLNGGKDLVLVVGGSVAGTADLYDPSSAGSAVAIADSSPRYSHTATLLNNGSVLVAGGFNSSTTTPASAVLASAELFNSAGSGVLPTGSLATARYLHSATLLDTHSPNDKVLVVGGRDARDIPLASAELYDPVTQTWTPTGSLAIPRSGHIATLMPGGKILVMGGRNASDQNLSSAELYDPVAGTWSGTANLQYGRAVFSATLFNSGPVAGKVLVVGGDGKAGTLSSVELHN